MINVTEAELEAEINRLGSRSYSPATHEEWLYLKYRLELMVAKRVATYRK